MKTILFKLIGLLLLAGSFEAWGQTPASTGTISGRVVGADGQPIPHAAVSITMSSGTNRMPTPTVCDDEGNFSFTDLTGQRYALSAFAPGYVEQRTMGVFYSPGSTVTLTLVKGGVITGRVTDAQGEPIVGVKVGALLKRDARGFEPRGNIGLYLKETDDRGEYRIYGMREGVYLVMANAPEPYTSPVSAYQNETPTYYPSADRAAAEEVTVRHGDEARGIDIRYRGERGYTISGKVSGSIESKNGAPGPVRINLKHASSGVIYSTTFARTEVGQIDFAFHTIPAGEYELVGERYEAQTQTHLARVTPRRVQVKNVDVSDVTLTLKPLGTVTGRLVLAAAAPDIKCVPATPQALEEVSILARRVKQSTPAQDPADVPTPFGRVNKEGNFVIRGMDEGVYLPSASTQQNVWYTQALTLSAAAGKPMIDLSRTGIVMTNGEDLTGLSLTLAAGATSLTGRVVPANGRTLSERLRVFLLPAEAGADDNLLRYGETRAAGETGGRFGFARLAPGRYRLFAEPVPASETTPLSMNLIVWDQTQRARLRRLAAVQPEIELKACEQRRDYEMRLIDGQ